MSGRWYHFSNTGYVLLSLFIILHTIGGHYPFERVPFDAVTNFFGFERNHYDRLTHFSVGSYAYPIAEFLMRKRLVHMPLIVALFSVFAITTVAGVHEILEWQYALSADPAAGIAVLGSQGDIWGAQKDILADTLGAILVIGLFFFQHKQELKTPHQPLAAILLVVARTRPALTSSGRPWLAAALRVRSAAGAWHQCRNCTCSAEIFLQASGPGR